MVTRVSPGGRAPRDVRLALRELRAQVARRTARRAAAAARCRRTVAIDWTGCSSAGRLPVERDGRDGPEVELVHRPSRAARRPPPRGPPPGPAACRTAISGPAWSTNALERQHVARGALEEDATPPPRSASTWCPERPHEVGADGGHLRPDHDRVAAEADEGGDGRARRMASMRMVGTESSKKPSGFQPRMVRPSAVRSRRLTAMPGAWPTPPLMRASLGRRPRARTATLAYWSGSDSQ